MAAGAVSAPLIIPIILLPTSRVKNHIDSRTPVSIQSDSSDVQIFFTLDGSRPEVGQRGPTGASRKYSRPFLLPAGQVSIRAVAVTVDGRQSSIVTKVFHVDQLDSSSSVQEEEEGLQNLRQEASDGTLSSAEKAAGSSLRPAEPRTMGWSPRPPGPRFLNSRPGPRTVPDAWTSSSQRARPVDSRDRKQLSSTQERCVQRETHFLRCPCCLSLRPSDPFARFCAECGAVVPPLPGERLPPAEGGQMLCCVTCNSLVPSNTSTCLICEASIGPQRQPQARLALQDHLLCVSCGSGNPAHMSRCLTCESHLQPMRRCEISAPSVCATDHRMLTCSRCKRLNRSDARFCDWCSSRVKATQAASCVECWRCGASGDPYALYCATCGILLEGPAPPTSSSDIRQPVISDTTGQVNPPTMTRSTQTVGLYYPSATELQKKDQQRPLVTRDHRPPLTAISPGRGFWRKQLDHVCAHLRSYTQNNIPFRTLLGEPRLGRMASAVVQEDPYEVSLTLSFMLARRNNRLVLTGTVVDQQLERSEPASPATETLSSVTERFAVSQSTTN
ncbi:double zinc ribbon and ankyrin repeat-containing protein 1 [Austrofundulus limnaeus]|uniref:Double zinc ribbon and ankyrin repeat-containing protein 1 n=1 Tax=Austrofundulus limnaeus TaxID=52670 RepID=A0A2I4CIQ0_AUSLI|nr:PREDICTED: double zinc ribbon and ankyrin repeat-containing protein 1 [Austrofundulus limnaeus]